jgi:hypothetical protein
VTEKRGKGRGNPFKRIALSILDEQLELYAQKSAGGMFLSEDEISSLKTIVEAWAKLQSVKTSPGGVDLNERTSKWVKTDALLKYAKEE